MIKAGVSMHILCLAFRVFPISLGGTKWKVTSPTKGYWTSRLVLHLSRCRM